MRQYEVYDQNKNLIYRGNIYQVAKQFKLSQDAVRMRAWRTEKKGFPKNKVRYVISFAKDS